MGSRKDEERSEEATPHALREARKRGQVAKSADFNSAIVLLAGFSALYLTLDKGVNGFLGLSQSLLAQAHNIAFQQESLVQLFSITTAFLGGLLMPLALALIIAGIGVNMAQSGPLWSTTPLSPDIKRLDPIAGFKRLFSKKTLYEAVKSVVKTVVALAILYVLLSAVIRHSLSTLDISSRGYVPMLQTELAYVAFTVLAYFTLLALFDLSYSRWEFAKRMRMSRREIKEEAKHREGDPLIRAKIKQLRREALKRAASLRKAGDADVLITNPTHLAVALKYERDRMPAPQVVAKASGTAAQKMKHFAQRHGVPVVENRLLARALFSRAMVDGWVPEELFPQVAKVLVWAALLRKQSANA